MSDNDRLETLLDDWEELLQASPSADVDAFIQERASDLDEDSRAMFRQKAAALATMGKRLNDLQNTANAADATPASASSNDVLASLQPGYEPLEGYKLVERLGEGGFGQVWKATDAQDFSVAIKFVDLTGRLGEKELRSLDVIRDVRHPHLLTVFGTRRIDDVLVIAMELADRTLQARFDEARKEGYDGIPREELLVYMSEAAKGIDYLNAPGSSGRPRIQHRDIKPANLLLSGNSVKIADFGLAQALTYNVTESTGSTPAFAAPEFFEGDTTSRSDQYSLAATYCYLRSGRLPFEGDVAELMQAHRSREPDLSMLPAAERLAVARALAKKSKDRWPSCSDFVDALKATGSEPPAPSPSSVSDFLHQLQGLSPKTKLIGGVATCCIVLLLALTTMFAGGGSDDPPPSGKPPRSTTAGSTAQDNAEKTLTLAVLDFANHSQEPALEGYRLGFRDMLTTDLAKLSAIKVLERSQLEALLKEHDLAKTDFIDQDSAVQLGRGLSAQAMLSGSYVISGDDIRVDVRLVSVETGEVLQAEAVEGKKSDMFGLQKSLAAKVLAGLDVQPTDAEQEALNEPQTRDFDAFRLYSEARLAQIQGQQAEAEKRFKESLAKDRNFQLAARELDRLETDALTRITEDQRRRAEAAGEIGQQLAEHLSTHQAVVAAGQRDPAYFASLLVLAAHAGLAGDSERERKLLITFWQHFAESVPPDDCRQIATEIKKLAAIEGEFFQQHVDSGKYGILINQKANNYYLRSELQGNFKWPRWSVMWPFSEDLRVSFDTAQRSQSGQFGVKIDPGWFDSQLPYWPHDYLESIFYGISDARQKNEQRFADALLTLVSVVGYYGRISDESAATGIKQEVDGLHSSMLRHLKDLPLNMMQTEFLEQAIPVLERLAQTDTDPKQRQEADTLLVRFVQQLRINEGVPSDIAPGEERPAELYGLKLDGSPVIFVWHLGDLSDFDMSGNRIEEDARNAVSDVLRALPGDVSFNFRWAGFVDEEKAAPLFGQPQPADSSAKQEGLKWLAQKQPGHIEETVKLDATVESLIDEFDSEAIVVLLVLDNGGRIKQGTVDKAAESEASPRFFVISQRKNAMLGSLAAASHGAAVRLKAKGGFLGTDKVVAEPWDLNAEAPK